MYIEKAFRAKNDLWRYLVGGLLAFLASQLGAIPLVVAVILKSLSEGRDLMDIQDQSKIMTILDSNLTLFLMLLSFAFGMAALYLVIRYLHKQRFTDATTSRKKVDWNRIFFAFGLVGVITVSMTVLDYYINPDDYVINFQLKPFLILLIIAVILIPIQTSFEEYLFRGYLMQGIGIHARNRWVPLVITSVIFGGLHFFNPEVGKMGNIIMIYYIGTGFFLGIMTLMDEGLELALGYHAGNNLFAALLVTADWTVFQTPSILKDITENPSAGMSILFPVFVIYPILLGIMSRKYKWFNWKEKLFGKVKNPIPVSSAPAVDDTFHDKLDA